MACGHTVHIANKCQYEMPSSIFFHQEFGEAGTMLSATCDEFLKNLCDCVELAEGNFGELKYQALTVN